MLLPDEISGRSMRDASSAKVVRRHIVDGRTWFVIGLEGWSADEIVVDDEFALRRVGRSGAKWSAKPASGIRQSKFTRVLTYEPELFDEEPPDMNMDW